MLKPAKNGISTLPILAFFVAAIFMFAAMQISVHKHSDQTPFKVDSSTSLESSTGHASGSCQLVQLEILKDICTATPVPPVTAAQLLFIALVVFSLFAVASFFDFTTKFRQRPLVVVSRIHFLQAGSFTAWFLSLQKRDPSFA